MHLRFFRIFFITMIVVSVSLLSSALPAIAAPRAIPQGYTSAQGHGTLPHMSTINTNDPILLIHGINEDCGVWSNTVQYIQGTHTVAGQQIHWTGPIVKIGYYTNDNNCDINLAKVSFPHCKGYEDTNLGTNNESIRHLGCEVAWYIYALYTQHGKNAEVVGHSMGGLIIRWALYGTQTHLKHFPTGDIPSASNLLVRDVVDFDTPNGGIDPKLLDLDFVVTKLGNYLGCTYKKGTWICPVEVVQIETGSSFMMDLNNNAQNPQGAKGTNWNLMGVAKGTSCLSLPPQSTTFMDGGNKILYTYPCYSHITISALKDYAMMDDPSPTETLDGVVKYCNDCPKSPATWQSSSIYPHALLRTLYALVEIDPIHVGKWSPTTSMHDARSGAKAIHLLDDRILVIGGDSQPSAEIYNPTTKTWSLTGPMNDRRAGHTATRLPDGRVLVVGGYNGSSVVASAEIFDPGTGIWTQTGSMHIPRIGHTATLLSNGDALVAGGEGDMSPATNTVEILNVSTGTWTLTSSMNVERAGQTATRFSDGRVLVVGGYNGDEPYITTLASAEIYNPTTKTWSLTGSLHTGRFGHTVSLLSNGTVLVVAGDDGTGHALVSRQNALSKRFKMVPASACFCPHGTNTAEIYNPMTSTWSMTGSLHTGRAGQAQTQLVDHTILVSGGISCNITTEVCNFFASVEVYNPTTGTWSLTGSMGSPRASHTTAGLANGIVVAAGGYNNSNSLSSAELYYP